MTEIALPTHLESERALLGACIFDNDVIHHMRAELTEEAFSTRATRLLFKAMCDLMENDEPVDFVTLSAWCKCEEVLGKDIPTGFISDLIDAVPTSANASHYIAIVRDRGARRQFMQACWRAADKVSDVKEQDALKNAITELQSVQISILTTGKQKGLKRFSTINTESLSTLQYRVDHKITGGIKTGFKEIDDEVGGFYRKDLIILAARPSVGKTAWALDVALNVCPTQPVLIFSLEMGEFDVWQRLTVKRCRKVSLHTVRNNLVSGYQWEEITRVVGDNEDLAIWIDESSRLRPLEIRARVQAVCLQERIQPGLIIVDYLQIMEPDVKSQSRERDVASMSAAMKAIAKDFDCPVLLLSQLNREVSKRSINDQLPRLEDLRESGAIEQDADVVLMMWRKWLVEQTRENENHAQMAIRKNRNGPTGKFLLHWDHRGVCFSDPVITGPSEEM